MISIQSAMLVALGFLGASLFACLIAPAFWSRAVRLTTRRLREALPVNEAEVRAERDRLRAENAITVHTLEQRVEQAELQRARQMIEINRRDAAISKLELESRALRSNIDEHQNARRVLEQTVSDRLPKVEQRLTDAKTAIFNRDREIAELSQTGRGQKSALDEAKSINAQQGAEIDRLTTALTTRGAANKQAMSDPRFEGELAMLAELEALRAKTRDQAAYINRLQTPAARGVAVLAGTASAAGSLGANLNGNGAYANGAASNGTAGDLVRALTPAEDGRPEAERQIRALTAQVQDQAAMIARLRANVEAFENDTSDKSPIRKDSKIALKARLSAAQAELDQQGDTVKRLRTELANSNERLALQAAHFMQEMRRLGAGSLPTSGQPRTLSSTKRSLAERVSQARPILVAANPAPVVNAGAVAPTSAAGGTKPALAAVAGAASNGAKPNGASDAVAVNGTLNGHLDAGAVSDSGSIGANGSNGANANGIHHSGHAPGSNGAEPNGGKPTNGSHPAAGPGSLAATAAPDPLRGAPGSKPRLIDRISSLSKS